MDVEEKPRERLSLLSDRDDGHLVADAARLVVLAAKQADVLKDV